MATKKASPAQLAARKKFVEMVRSGAFKKRKNNPMHKYTVLHRGTANIAGEVMASGPQAAKQKVAEKLGIPTLAYLIAKKTNPAKKTVSQNSMIFFYLIDFFKHLVLFIKLVIVKLTIK